MYIDDIRIANIDINEFKRAIDAPGEYELFNEPVIMGIADIEHSQEIDEEFFRY